MSFQTLDYSSTELKRTRFIKQIYTYFIGTYSKTTYLEISMILKIVYSQS